MNRKAFNWLVDRIDKARLGLMVGKSEDYATEDVLANFKRMNQLCRLLDIDVRRSAYECALFLQLLKMDRKCNLKGRNPKNESVLDTVYDEHNYIDLGEALREEYLENDHTEV